MYEGRIKFFNEEKGFGFIVPDEGNDIFFHVTNLKEDVFKDDRVKFDTEASIKGLKAVNVSVI